MSEEYHAPTLNGFVAQTEHEMRPTVLISAFEGWNDAGSAASDAVRRILNSGAPKHLATVGEDDYYDYQFTRPQSRVTAEGRIIEWPTTELYRLDNPLAPADLLLVVGVEPTFRWQGFCAQIVKHAKAENVHVVLSLGALLADVPHTRPVPTVLNSDHPKVQEYFKLSASRYEGPTGIPAVLGAEFEKHGIPTMSLWAQLSHYVAQAPSPRVELAIVEMIEELVPMQVSSQKLREDAGAWTRGVDELSAADPEVAKYVQQLEQASDASELPEASGESIAREFERYLRRRGRARGEEHGPDFEI